MKKKSLYSFIIIIIFSAVFQLTSCTKIETSLSNEQIQKSKTTQNVKSVNSSATGFEISYWIDIDLRTNNGRGYWFHVSDKAPNPVPTSYEIWAAISRCRYTYHALSLYVIYHRQFDIDSAKSVLKRWKLHGDNIGMKIIPVVVLEDYVQPNAAMNLTDVEIPDFAEWCVNNINSNEFGVYDIYHNRQGIGTAQNTQLTIIKNRIGNKIVRLGLQPSESINPNILRAVQDTWTAECQGSTNDFWENPRSFQGSSNYGKNLLINWVNYRIINDSKKITWNLIPIAWDYSTVSVNDPYGYIFPGIDSGLLNDPPISGRVALCHTYIVSSYSGGSVHPKFGGYSCDLHILQANSSEKQETPNFYESIRSDNPYQGYFSQGINEVASVYDLYDNF